MDLFPTRSIQDVPEFPGFRTFFEVVLRVFHLTLTEVLVLPQEYPQHDIPNTSEASHYVYIDRYAASQFLLA